jgi:hypothetical protein
MSVLRMSWISISNPWHNLPGVVDRVEIVQIPDDCLRSRIRRTERERQSSQNGWSTLSWMSSRKNDGTQCSGSNKHSGVALRDRSLRPSINGRRVRAGPAARFRIPREHGKSPFDVRHIAGTPEGRAGLVVNHIAGIVRAVVRSPCADGECLGGRASTSVGNRHSIRYVTDPMRGPRSSELCKPMTTSPA